MTYKQQYYLGNTLVAWNRRKKQIECQINFVKG